MLNDYFFFQFRKFLVIGLSFLYWKSDDFQYKKDKPITLSLISCLNQIIIDSFFFVQL